MKVKHSEFFSPQGIPEHFFSVCGSCGDDFSSEAAAVLAAYRSALAEYGCSEASEVLLRLHLSDITNQEPELKQLLTGRNSFVSITGQPPVAGRIALEAWHWSGIKSRESSGGALTVKTQNYTAVWFQQEKIDASGSYQQTAAEFSALQHCLDKYGATVADHTLRTWLYCRDVDNNYAGLVKARNEYFTAIGLTPQTHFIASTGIEGQHPDVSRLVKMDSLNYPGIAPEQTEYVSAPEMLSPTALYGVSFERGSRLLFGDRSHCFISGTASIDKAGNVVHPGDVKKQTLRMLDNIEALLANAQSSLQDIKSATLYLRDIADAPHVTAIVTGRIGENIPLVILKAPVCRPAWLVEMECVAVNERGDRRFAALR